MGSPQLDFQHHIRATTDSYPGHTPVLRILSSRQAVRVSDPRLDMRAVEAVETEVVEEQAAAHARW